jgi:hypothetical protein
MCLGFCKAVQNLVKIWTVGLEHKYTNNSPWTKPSMCIYLYTYIRICIRIYVYICLCTYTHIYLHMRICVCVYTYTYIYINTNICEYIFGGGSTASWTPQGLRLAGQALYHLSYARSSVNKFVLNTSVPCPDTLAAFRVRDQRQSF